MFHQLHNVAFQKHKIEITYRRVDSPLHTAPTANCLLLTDRFEVRWRTSSIGCHSFLSNPPLHVVAVADDLIARYPINQLTTDFLFPSGFGKMTIIDTKASVLSRLEKFSSPQRSPHLTLVVVALEIKRSMRESSTIGMQ